MCDGDDDDDECGGCSNDGDDDGEEAGRDVTG